MFLGFLLATSFALIACGGEKKRKSKVEKRIDKKVRKEMKQFKLR